MSAAAARVIALPRPMPVALGAGAYLNASLCLIDGAEARITGAAGNLSDAGAVARYDRMLDEIVQGAGGGAAIACAGHDLHPDFHSTRRALALGCPARAVQHHHAHIAATLAEHGHEGPALGLALDGYGIGTDGGAWGGELLRVSGPEFCRLGALAPLAQPGGDAAAREPWRMGAAALHRLGRGEEAARRFAGEPGIAAVIEMLEKGVNAPPTSSCGRLFDAACGLLGVGGASGTRPPPAELEALAGAPEILPGGWALSSTLTLDFGPLLGRLPGLAPRAGAGLFHGTLIAGLAAWAEAGRARTGLDILALGGGCFANRILSDGLVQALQGQGITVLRPRALPPGDAGLSLGQAMIAALVAEREN